MGTVWRVWDRRDERFLAAKVLRQVDATSLLRFMREQSLRIDHRHVVMPLGWAGEDDRVLFTMPLMRGGSVATLVGDHGALPVSWVAVLLDQLLEALDAIHSSGLIHRDVKPANLMLEPTGTARPHMRLSDFGIAAPVDQPRLTRTDLVIGTPGYLAPEVLAGADPDPRQDLYAAGMTAIEMVTGSRPPAEVVPTDVLATQVAPGPLTNFIAQLVQHQPIDRLSSAPHARQVLAATGLVTPAGAAPPDEGRGIEIFDQVPALPAGWTDPNEVQEPPPVAEAAPGEWKRPGDSIIQQVNPPGPARTKTLPAGPGRRRAGRREQRRQPTATTHRQQDPQPPPPPAPKATGPAARPRRALFASLGAVVAGIALLIFAATRLL